MSYGSEMAHETATAMMRTAEWETDRAAVIRRVVGWATDSRAAGRHERARHWTAVACLLVGGPAGMGPDTKAEQERLRGVALSALVHEYLDG